MGMWDNVGKSGKLPQNKRAIIEQEENEDEGLSIDEIKKKRKGYLKYNRGKNGLFGDKSEAELIETN